MSKLQAKIWEVKKALPVLEKKTAGFKFKYADLQQIEEMLMPLLDEHGLGFQHKTFSENGQNKLSTTVFDLETKEVDYTTLVIPEGVTLAGMNGYQSLGSALTYFRRYNLLTLFDIIADEDVDSVVPQRAKPKTDYVRKVKENIAKGVSKGQLEAWFGKFRGVMQPEVRDEVYDIIQNMKT